MADVRLFTSSAYLRAFMPQGAAQAYVTPATWVDDEWILSERGARDTWSSKQGPVRMLFAGRLIAEKGVFVLLSAIKLAAETGMNAEISIHPIGDGGLLEDCIAAAANLLAPRAITDNFRRSALR